jgi:hypothetical protein
MNVNIEIANYNDKNISYRKTDGYVNATEMCQANGKKVNDWLRLKQTEAYIQELSIVTGILATDLTITKQGGIANEQGTWIHPKLTLELARWISVEFAIWCDTHLMELLTTGTTELKQNEVIPFVNATVEKKKNDPLTILATVIDLKEKLDGLKQDRLTELIKYQLTSQIEILNVNQRQLGTATVTKQKHYQPCNLRAKDLGYNIYQVSNGTELGRYVRKLVEPAFKDYQGQYHVWHYEVNNELDNVIHSYFKNDI